MGEKDQKALLMADDDAEDCMLATEAFELSGVNAAFSCVEDGVELIEHLSKSSHSGTGGLPDLILLDLNMPRKDGRKALLEIQSEPAFQHIPIIILSTSKEERDISFSMSAGARAFITKPATFDDWVEIMKSLARDWLEEVP
ncbi:MAG: response regulator [Syntrophobacteraceae bacterium]